MPIFFRLGEERRNIPLMKDFVLLIRQRLRHHGERRGRPILLAMRLPDTVELCLSAGLDPETWAREGWMDLLMAGMGLMPFSVPLDEWVGLGRANGVPVYACLDRLRPIFPPGRPRFFAGDPDVADDPSHYHGVNAAAYRFWAEGVDGIYLYDWHTHGGPTDPADYGFLPEMTDPARLARADRLYQIDPGYPIRPGMGALAPGCLPGELPRQLATQAGEARVGLSARIADEPEEASRAELRLQWRPRVKPARIAVRVNGAALAPGRPLAVAGHHQRAFLSGQDTPEGWIGYDLTPTALRRGENRLEGALARSAAGDPADPVELLQARIAISYAEPRGAT